MKQYVIVRDEITNQVQVIGRFENGLDEMFVDGKWESNGLLYSLQMDGLLEEVSEVEAMKLLSQKKSRQLQAA